MAIVSSVRQQNLAKGSADIYAWLGLTKDDEAEPQSVAHASEGSIQFAGTFGVAGEWHLDGSIDGQTYFTLTDVAGSPLEFTAEGLRGIAECVAWIKPVREAGTDAAMNVDVFLIVN